MERRRGTRIAGGEKLDRLGFALFANVEIVGAEAGGAQPVLALGRLLGAEDAVLVAQLALAVGGEQRGEDRGQHEDAHEHQAGDEHAALQADALAQLVDDRQSLPGPPAARCGSGEPATGG